MGNGSGFNTRQYTGSLSLVPVPTAKELAAFTQTALADLRYPLLEQAKLPPRENRPPQPVPERAGEPGVFQHVIYIIKENRSYDQVLGDVREGNGDADLCIFGERVTPNEHKLVRDFALLDNTYCCSILSADGHQWADSAHRDRIIWNAALPAGRAVIPAAATARTPRTRWRIRRRVSSGTTRSRTEKPSCDFGEFTSDTKRWKNSGARATPGFLDRYRNFTTARTKSRITDEPDIEALRPYHRDEHHRLGFGRAGHFPRRAIHQER